MRLAGVLSVGSGGDDAGLRAERDRLTGDLIGPLQWVRLVAGSAAADPLVRPVFELHTARLSRLEVADRAAAL